MTPEVMLALVDEVADLYQVQETKPQVVFHGGEPLLLGPNRLRELVSALVLRVPNVSLGIQTNGSIYNTAIEQLLQEFRQNMVFSVSVDGHKAENDRHRLGLRDRSVYDRIDTCLKRASAAGLLDGVLMVIDVRNDPARIFDFMCTAGASHYNILLQDGDYDHLPAGKAGPDSHELGEWLFELFRLYASGTQKFRIKFFDDIALSIVKDLRGIRSPPANYMLCTMTVDTNGEIKHNDTYRINSDGADSLAGQDIRSMSLHRAANSELNRDQLASVSRLPTKCVACKFLNSCGGGFPSHRFRQGAFDQPSVYCHDYLYLFERMESALCQ